MRPAIYALVLVLSGCGAVYTVTRTAPDGSSVVASAKTAERAGSIDFTFSGDPAGEMRIQLKKINTEPVNLTSETLRELLSAAVRVP